VFAKRMILLAAVLGVGCQELDGVEEGADLLSEGALAQQGASTATSAVRQPRYDERGRLIKPTDTDRWVFLGSGLNLNYTDGAQGGADFFTTTYMEPSAYQAFVDTGVFPEGTMTALVGYRAGSGAPPAKSGKYLGERALFEMSVKDSTKNPKDVWTYYGFRGDATLGEAHPTERCQSCHVKNAQTDLVFTQFYPNLRKPTSAPAR